ncbi:hypothetical protein [Alkaliphilus sp. B6464]|uniref:hypothetical protein n=1 Tax=Alkaliphilus sp. B6464 TaxID=2731219 RepID=UPI001BA8750A|nr:hypothetical protein [Alkaliphilus sp. B6464]QUH22098.1 hypothetical protein HYG84_19520 [Alkaliphilus sp. B6464]
MANVRIWSEEIDEELINFMDEGKKQGMQISFLAEQFSSKYPIYDKEQVRTHYYQILKTQKFKNKDYGFKPWTIEEDEYLMNYISQNEKDKNKVDLFEELATRLDRNPQAIASHYYQLNKRKDEIEETDNLMEQIGKINLSKAEQILNILKEVQQYDDKDKEIAKLQNTIKQLEIEKKDLADKLIKANQTIEKYNKKFQNLDLDN